MRYLSEWIENRLAFPTVDAGGEAVGGGGGTPSPAPSSDGGGVSTAPPSSPPDGGGETAPSPGEAPDFALSDDVMFASDLDAIEIPEIEQPAQPPATPPAQPAQPPAEPAQPQAAKPPVAPQAQPQAKPAAQPQAEGGVPSRTPSAPELLNMVLQNRTAILGELANKRFTLSQAEQEELETNAIGAIPKLLARVYFDAYTSSMNYINQQVPGMITSHITEAAKDTEAESAFYSAWPGIDKSKHAADVMAFATTFRQLNPKATLDEAIKFTGSAIAAKYGLQNASKPVTPPAPPKGPSRRPAPFTPAAGGRTVSTAAVEGNPWDGLGMSFDE